MIQRFITPVLTLLFVTTVAYGAEDAALTVDAGLYRLMASISGETSKTADVLSMRSSEIYTPGPRDGINVRSFEGHSPDSQDGVSRAYWKRDEHGEIVIDSETGEPVAARAEAASANLSVFTLADLTIGDFRLQMDSNGVMWNGGPLPASTRQIEPIALPRLKVVEGQPAEIAVTANWPTQYMEPADTSGQLFKLHSSEEELGTTLKLQAHKQSDGRVRLEPFSVRFRAITGREPIGEGIYLDIGKPHIADYRFDVALALTVGEPLGILWTTEQGTMMLLVAVTDSDGDGHNPIQEYRAGTTEPWGDRRYTTALVASQSAHYFFERIAKPDPSYHSFAGLWALEEKAKPGDAETIKHILREAEAVITSESSPVHQRWQTCYVISATRSEQGLPLLERGLGDPDATVRGVAACALGQLNSSDAIAVLKRAKKTEADAAVLDWITRALDGEFAKK